MQSPKIPGWLARAIASLGGSALFVVAFLDSSVLSFPFVTDLLLMERAHANPARMPLYALGAAAGSLAGCIWLYYLARKGGEAYYRRHSGGESARVRQWVTRNGFLSAAVPSVLPPPMPFKIFVIAAGVFQVRIGTFIAAILIGRGLRYFVEGFLAIRYGDAAAGFLLAHKFSVTAAVIALMIAGYWVSRRLMRGSPDQG